MILVLSHPV